MSDLSQELLAAFQVEHREHLEGIRSVLGGMDGDAGVQDKDLEEALRRAHTLKGAARAVDLAQVQTLAHRLETLFSRIRQGTLAADRASSRVVHGVLDWIEEEVAALLQGRLARGSRQAVEDLDRLLGIEPSLPASAPKHPPQPAGELPVQVPAVQEADSLRLSADSLDRLLRTGGELSMEILQKDTVGRELAGIERQWKEMEAEWGRLHRFSHSGADPTEHESRSLAEERRESMERRFRALGQRIHAVHGKHQRSAQVLRGLGNQLQEDIRRARMVPAGSVFQAFRKMVLDLAREQGKEIDFRFTGSEVVADRMVLQVLKDPLMHILRNAVGHGIEARPERAQRGKDPVARLALEVAAMGNRLRVSIADDGRGMNLRRIAEAAVQKGLLGPSAAPSTDELLRLIFRPGFSTASQVTELSGRGMGLSVASEAATRLQGEVSATQEEGKGSAFVFSVPITVSTCRLLLVRSLGQVWGVPVHGIEKLVRVEAGDLDTLQGRLILRLRDQPIPIHTLSQALDGTDSSVTMSNGALDILLLRSGTRRAAMAVDGLVSERDGLVRDAGPAVRASPKFTGAILMDDGAVCLVLNPVELINGMLASQRGIMLETAPVAVEEQTRIILVVDDSFTTRTLEKAILEASGYRVLQAVNGSEGLARLRAEKVDLVVSDIQMPVMDGLAMLEAIKSDARLAGIPIILVSSLDSSADQERGLSLGADAYLQKQKFDEKGLLEIVRQLL